MILRGLWLLARGRKSGMQEFDPSLDGFTASLAPLIAFPLVGAAALTLGGQWEPALVGLFSRLCAVLVLPLITHEFARRMGREPLWLRTASALNWSFWVLIPVLLIAAFLAATLVESGLPMQQGEYAAIGLITAYLLWYHWFIARVGLVLSAVQAGLFVLLSGVAVGLFTFGPALMDYAYYGKIMNH